MREPVDRFRVALVINERATLLSAGVTAGDVKAGARFLAGIDEDLKAFLARLRSRKADAAVITGTAIRTTVPRGRRDQEPPR